MEEEEGIKRKVRFESQGKRKERGGSVFKEGKKKVKKMALARKS